MTREPPQPDQRALPSVGAVLVTHNRPELMRRALASILDQEYAAPIRVVVVFDRSEPDLSLVSAASAAGAADGGPERRVEVITNARTPGLAGARNTGVLWLDEELIAFCDDDDSWLPGKLAAQVERLSHHPEAQFCTTGMRVDYQGASGESPIRLAHQERVTLDDMTRSRMTTLHSSSFLFRRTAMLDGFGLVDETLPRSMAEDWDLLLRAARSAPIENVDEPLVAIQWGASSYFIDVWKDKNEAHTWLLEHHPEFEQNPVGAAMMHGKLAFGHAALGERKAAVRHAARSIRTRWREPRGYLGLAVVAGVRPGWITTQLNRRGHGI